MAEIGFYHLTKSTPEQALAPLLGRTLAAGQRAVVRCATEERVAALDAALWLCQDPDWLPHGTKQTNEADLQPIWLTTEEEAPNGARFLFLIEGTAGNNLGAFDRVFDLFDGRDDAAVGEARARGNGQSLRGTRSPTGNRGRAAGRKKPKPDRDVGWG